MAEERVQRRLAAILAADVVGFSRLMERDESATLAVLKDRRKKVLEPLVKHHQGRVFKVAGDGVLVQFGSAVDAVQCAIDLQREMASASADLPEDCRIVLRIGINLGDVMVEGNDFYGDGVNIAARLEQMADPGGILISGAAYDQVRNKIKSGFDDVGAQSLKNIQEPVRLYRVAGTPQIAPAAAMAPTDKPSIAVLPFINMSDDPQQEYFADGITEDITTDLSKVSALFVIARNTAFAFKGKSEDVPQIARQLKVSHILEGSVRKAGGRVRITAQLVHGKSGGHIWAERFDRELNNVFSLQDEISEAIVKALQLKLLPEEKKAIGQRGTDNVDAYNLYLMAHQSYIVDNEADEKSAEAIIRLCRRATEIDPTYTRAWTLMALGQTKLRNIRGGAGDDGLAATERALSLDPNLAEAHAVKARILAEQGLTDKASVEIAIALRLDPESYEVNRSAGLLSYRQHRIGDSIPHWERAVRLMGSDINSVAMLISCYHSIGDAEGVRRAAQIAFARAEKVLARDQNNGAVVSYSAYALAALGEASRAKERMDRVLLIEPDNLSRRYNFACALTIYLNDTDSAIEFLGPVFAKMGAGFLNHAKADPDLVPLRDDPRFRAMVAAAEERLGQRGTGLQK
jgi:adenylate cyclase